MCECIYDMMICKMYLVCQNEKRRWILANNNYYFCAISILFLLSIVFSIQYTSHYVHHLPSFGEREIEREQHYTILLAYKYYCYRGCPELSWWCVVFNSFFLPSLSANQAKHATSHFISHKFFLSTQICYSSYNNWHFVFLKLQVHSIV